MSTSHVANADQLRWLFVAFRAGTLVLLAQVGSWIVNLALAA